MKKSYRTPLWLCAGALCFVSSAYGANAQDASLVQVNRYVTQTTQPMPAQVNPLLALVSVRFSSNIVTIEGAMRHVLRHSGYTLAPLRQRTAAEHIMLQQPLPLVNRTLSAISVQDALQTLAGKAIFTLVQDPLHRWVSFRLTREARTVWAHTLPWEMS